MQTPERPIDLTLEVTKDDHALGPAEAPVTLVEYGDYECPDCLNAFPIVQRLTERGGDRLRFVFRHFPQYSVHPHAGVAAQAAESAALQGKFWPMHEALFENQKRLGEIEFGHLALRLGLELYGFESEIGSARVIKKVAMQRQSGVESGVGGTPTFFINGRRYRGANEFDALWTAIESAPAVRLT